MPLHASLRIGTCGALGVRYAREAARLIDHMRGDKKAADGRLTFVLVRGIGKAFVSREVDEKALRGLLDDAIAA